MSLSATRGLGRTLTLGLSLVAIACTGLRPPASSPSSLGPSPRPNLLQSGDLTQDALGWREMGLASATAFLVAVVAGGWRGLIVAVVGWLYSPALGWVGLAAAAAATVALFLRRP